MKTRSITPERALLSRAIVGPGGRKSGAVLIAGGKIVDIVGRDEVPADCSSEDFGDLVVSPGLVDSHVHINEPGRTEWEGFETATRAAAAGGITTLIDMPLNSTPVTTNDIALQAKVNAANGQCWVDYGFYGGLVPGNVAGLRSLIDAGVLGIKAFLIHSGIDDFPNVTEADLRTAMPVIAQSGIPLLVHAELNTGSNLKKSDSPRSYAEYMDSRPRAWENKAIELMTRLSREFNCRVHIVHLSSSDAIPRLKQARQSGLPITVETCPHYLVFSSECIRDGDTRFKCAPPIRENENRKLLWAGLRDSVIDFIVSDHSPCPPELKEIEAGDFQRAWGGISSLQFGLPAVWTEAREQG
ncbi:MAG: allantoinase AllB, partial [Ignavibacteriae bacterium]|nr:allantoinase AllB [Ignavibacteriota bacterium]